MPDLAYRQIYTTVDVRERADALAESAVRARLAACAQVVGPMTSTYWWEGAVDTAQEYLIIFKTTDDRASDLQDHILRHHAYEVPEIIHMPVIDGNPAYLEWLVAQTRATGEPAR